MHTNPRSWASEFAEQTKLGLPKSPNPQTAPQFTKQIEYGLPEETAPRVETRRNAQTHTNPGTWASELGNKNKVGPSKTAQATVWDPNLPTKIEYGPPERLHWQKRVETRRSMSKRAQTRTNLGTWASESANKK